MRAVSVVLATLATLALAACATTAPVIPGAAPGKFVTLTCADNKVFQLRVSDNGGSVRVRALHGSAELEAQSGGVFSDGSYVLRTQGEGAVSLEHQGKPEARGCKVAS
jgi:membrane-bound inhibitor of C-type lysozyme